jgi:serine/threonine protein kinase
MLMKSVARVLVKYAGNFVGAGIAGDAIVDIWKLWDHYTQNSQDKRAEVEPIAMQSSADARREVAEIVAEEGVSQNETVRQAITAYLTQLPAAIRQSQRRPQDPSGRSVSDLLSLRRAEDLRIILPPRLPRFKAGDHPPGIGDWQLEELLGMGGFGEVWKACNPYMAERAALKFCLDPEAAKALRNEAILLGRVQNQGQHPRIVRLRNTYLRADPPCLEYEYVAGGDLAGLAYQQMQKNQGKMPPDLARKIIRYLSRTMSHPHQLTPPIVHRDLKPSNILVQRASDGTVTFRITDFGIGGVAADKAIEKARDTSSSHFLATALRGAHTPLYSSPQQLKGGDPDPRDDVYALGVIWYQMLIGDLSKGAPHGTGWMKALREQGVSDAELQLLQSCFEDNPADRPADAGALAHSIEDLTKPEPDPGIGTPVTVGTTSKPPRYTLLGFPVTAVLRWMGKQGWTKEEALKALAYFKIDCSPLTVAAQISGGAKGRRGDPAPITAEQARELDKAADRNQPTVSVDDDESDNSGPKAFDVINLLGGGEVISSKNRCYRLTDGRIVKIQYSKFHERYRVYWYGINPASYTQSKALGCTDCVFIMAEDGFVLVPIALVDDYLPHAYRTENADGTIHHYHVQIGPPPDLLLKGDGSAPDVELASYYQAFG